MFVGSFNLGSFVLMVCKYRVWVFLYRIEFHAMHHYEGWSDKKKKRNMKIIEEICRDRPHGKKASTNSRLNAI